MGAPGLTRRSLLKTAGGFALATGIGLGQTSNDEEFLEDLSRRSFRFFEECTDPVTGITADAARRDGSRNDSPRANVGSIASTGFGLAAFCLAADRGWIERDDA